VSDQINALCDVSPICAPARFERHKAAAAASEQDLQREVDSLRARLASSAEHQSAAAVREQEAQREIRFLAASLRAQLAHRDTQLRHLQRQLQEARCGQQ
jgi:hypothetical protein